MDNKTFIIAEAGVNHNGDINIAKKLIEKAAESGVDAVKFQSFKADRLASKDAQKAKYQMENIGRNEENQYVMLKRLELSCEDHLQLIEHCKKNKILFLSSAFDLESIELLKGFNIPLFKVPSGEIDNVPYLRRIAESGKKVIISTGMCNMEDIEFAVKTLRNSGAEDITILHCNTEYPTPMEDVNLRAMLEIGEVFKLPIGYSDHTLGIEVPIAAVALGATVIEKHFTLDRNMEGPDHKASLEPNELKEMVKAIRNIEKALGSKKKTISNSEAKNVAIARKSIICRKNIQKGEKFNSGNIIAKRPGGGISPREWDIVIGCKAKRDFNVDEMIEL